MEKKAKKARAKTNKSAAVGSKTKGGGTVGKAFRRDGREVKVVVPKRDR